MSLQVRDALNQAQAAGLDRLDAQWLVLHAAARPLDDRAWLLSHDEFALDPAQWAALIQRRLQGEPLAYITGFRGFYGLELAVDSRVLDPRPDTETLVDWALSLDLPETARVIDLGTGSGAIALACKAQRPRWQVHATDLSTDALAVAQANSVRLKLPITFHQGPWFAAIEPSEHTLPFDAILSNPPYIADGDPHLDALHHEPAMALSCGVDGLNAIRSIVSEAPQFLRAGGWLLLEHGYDQAVAVQTLLREAGFQDISTRQDLSGNPRCTGGRKPRG
jgi:release factor glutamine methyltransferase